MFLGYPFGKRGWKVYYLETQEIFVSRGMVFHEDHFPFGRVLDTREPSDNEHVFG